MSEWLGASSKDEGWELAFLVVNDRVTTDTENAIPTLYTAVSVTVSFGRPASTPGHRRLYEQVIVAQTLPWNAMLPIPQARLGQICVAACIVLGFNER